MEQLSAEQRELDLEIARIRQEMRLLLPSVLHADLPQEILAMSDKLIEVLRQHSVAWEKRVASKNRPTG